MDTEARIFFPRGMIQPEGGYRFSLDPLLLACFARVKKGVRLVDLGTGCGVAALAALLRHEAKDSPEPARTPGSPDTLETLEIPSKPSVSALGLDIDPAMVEAAARNAARLGLEEAFGARLLDIRQVRSELAPEFFGLALLNPPYRPLETGRACGGPERTKARFEAQGGLEDFLDATAWLLANRGAAALVYPAGRLAQLLHGLVERRLTPKRLRLVHSRLEEPAKLVLLEAVKNGGAGLTVEPPLALYGRQTGSTGQDGHKGQPAAARLSAAALEFCPFLACNA